MKYCKDCWGFGRCKAQGRTVDFPVDDGVCCHFDPIMPMTNADRIRAMTDEELANMVVCPYAKNNWDKCKDDCFACRLEWLKQPAEGDA